MILGKKKKYEKLKVQYELLENDMSIVTAMELYGKDKNSNQNKKQSFLIKAQQLRILTEIYLVMPKHGDNEKIKILMDIFYTEIQNFIGSETEFNQDRILMCKIFLGKQYKNYQDNILEMNGGVDEGKLEGLDKIMDLVLSLVETMGKEIYLVYGQEILNNIEKELKGKQLITDKILHDIKLHRKFLSDLESEELYLKKEELMRRKEEVKKELKEEIKRIIKK